MFWRFLRDCAESHRNRPKYYKCHMSMGNRHLFVTTIYDLNLVIYLKCINTLHNQLRAQDFAPPTESIGRTLHTCYIYIASAIPE